MSNRGWGGVARQSVRTSLVSPTRRFSRTPAVCRGPLKVALSARSRRNPGQGKSRISVGSTEMPGDLEPYRGLAAVHPQEVGGSRPAEPLLHLARRVRGRPVGQGLESSPRGRSSVGRASASQVGKGQRPRFSRRFAQSRDAG